MWRRLHLVGHVALGELVAVGAQLGVGREPLAQLRRHEGCAQRVLGLGPQHLVRVEVGVGVRVRLGPRVGARVRIGVGVG